MNIRSRSRFLVAVTLPMALSLCFFYRERMSLVEGIENIKNSNAELNATQHIETNSQAMSCFEARNSTIYLSRHLFGPFINVGMPKMGSTSLHKYFCCGNYTSSHWECGKGNGLCADCMKNAVLDGLPPLESCGNFESYMQMDRDSFFPQIELLSEIHKESPNATFLLMFRDMNDWYRSLSNWNAGNSSRHTAQENEGKSLAARLTNANITGLPPGKGSSDKEMSEFFCNHVQNIRNFVKRHPSHGLIELDITSHTVGLQLERLTGISRSCWGESNKNPMLHEVKSDKVPNVCLR